MKKAIELSHRQMKDVTGGGGPEHAVHDLDSAKHCYIDGELIFEAICTTNAQCQNVYGSDAKCY